MGRIPDRTKPANGNMDTQRVFLGVFGKHPGWDDHVDDLGLETDRLIALKRLLYVQGIGGNIDSGAWDDLQDDQRLDGFGHVLLYDVGDDLIAGRMWSSRDGKGRAKYPMVVCVQCSGLPIEWVLDHVPDALADIEAQCVATESADDVIAILDRWRERLRAAAVGVDADSAAAEAPGPGPLSRVADDPALGPDRLGLMRVLYQTEREMAPFHVGAVADGATRPASLMRAPALSGPWSLTWLRLLRRQLDRSAPIMQIAPLNEPWIDLLVGEPTAQHLHCVRATPEVAPLTTEVPYTIPPEFVQRVNDAIGASAAGGQERVTTDVVVAGGEISGQAKAVGAKAVRATAAAGGFAQRLVRMVSEHESRKLIWICLGVAAALILLPAIWAILPTPGAEPKVEPAPPTTPAPQTLQVDQEDWIRFCRAYYDWLGVVDATLTPEVRTRWREQSAGHIGRNIVELLDRAAADGVALVPRKLVATTGWSINDIIDSGRAPADLSAELASPAVAARVARAAAVVAAIESEIKPLSPDHPDGSKALGELVAIDNAWTDRRWSGAAAFAESGLAPIELDRTLVRAVDKAMTVHAAAVEIEQRRRRIEAARMVADSAGVELLSSFGAYAGEQAGLAANEVGPTGVGALTARVGELAALGGELVGFVEGDWADRIDQVLVQQDPKLTGPVVAGELNDRRYRAWMDEVRNGPYGRLAADQDPRRVWPSDLAELFADVRTDIARLSRGGYDAAAIAGFVAWLDTIKRNADPVSELRWDQPNRQAVLDGFAAAEADRDALIEKVAIAQSAMGDTRKMYIAGLPHEIISGSGAVNQLWRKYRDQLCRSQKSLTGLQQKIESLKKALVAVDGRFDAAKVDGVASAEVLAGLTLAATAERERVVGRAVAAMSWTGAELTVGADAGDASVRSYRAKLDGLAGLAVDAAVVADLLDACGGLDEANAAGRTMRQIHAAWAGDAWVAEPVVYDALKTVARPMADMITIADSSDAARLAAQAGSGRLPAAIRRAAWRRLGALSWPATIEQLETESVLQGQLRTVYEAFGDQALRRRLTAELSAEGRGRWRICFRQAADGEAVAAALKMRTALGVDVSTDRRESDFFYLPETSRYNILLANLQMAAAAGPEGLLAKRDQFLAEVRRHAPSATAVEAVDAFLTELSNLESLAATEVCDLSSVLGEPWLGVAAADNSRVTFSWPAPSDPGASKHTLTFLRVEADGRSAYLCTTETSVALMIDLHKAVGERDIFDSGMLDADAPAGHPTTWRNLRRQMLVAASWMDTPGYHPSLVYPDGLSPAAPSADCPVQRIPPSSALVVARLLNCRFPTAAEWRAAGRRTPADTPRMSNLRDQTWDLQRRHMVELRNSGRMASVWLWPDAGIFWPAGVTAARKAVGEAARIGDKYKEYNDGFLWFAPVAGAGEGFFHLVGNVAEFVFDDPGAMDEDLGADGAIRTSQADAFLHSHSSSLGVIGGSALSPPELWDGRDKPFDKAYPVDLRNSAGAATDVGFRLAFTAPVARPADRLRRMLTDPPYLRP